MGKVTFDQIMTELIWVVKFNQGSRITTTYNKINHNDENIREVDLCGKQPEHLQDFTDAYNKYCMDNAKFIGLDEFYIIWMEGALDA